MTDISIKMVNLSDFNPESFIHIIRGQQIIIDSDLALLYDVETKYLNRTANRHESRFPEDFRFKLTTEEFENLRCQFGTSNETGSHGGRRYLLYAYTEQGVAMLSGLLNSERAVQVSIGIMRAFVEMRKFIASNAALLDRMATVEFRQLEYQKNTDERFEKVFSYLESHTLPSEKIFFKGEMFDAFILLTNLIRSAKKNLLLVDGYVDDCTLNILAKKEETVERRIVTFPSAPLTTSDVKAFEKQYGTLPIIRTTDFHDRFLIIDEQAIYHIGASLKDAGKKAFAITLINNAEVTQSLLKKIQSLPWSI